MLSFRANFGSEAHCAKPMINKPLPTSACVLLLLCAATAANAQAFADAQAELVVVDNLTRSERATDAREDTAFAVTAKAGVHLQPGDYTGLTFTGTLNRTQFRRYTGLSSSEAGLAVAVSRKFGLGDFQPTLSTELGLARNEFNLGIRDAWIYRAGLGLQKRLTDTLKLSGGLRYEKRDGDHDVPRNIPVFPRSGASWDVASRNVFLTAELDLGPATWASATYQVQDGDVTSTAVSYAKIFNAATAITLDPLFGPLTVAYRIPARTYSLALDLNRAVFASGTLYLGVEYQETHGKNGIDYDTGLIRSGFIYSF